MLVSSFILVSTQVFRNPQNSSEFSYENSGSFSDRVELKQITWNTGHAKFSLSPNEYSGESKALQQELIQKRIEFILTDWIHSKVTRTAKNIVLTLDQEKIEIKP